MAVTPALSSLTLLLLLLFITAATPSLSPPPHHQNFSSIPLSLGEPSALQQNLSAPHLEYDYYRDTCPKAEEIIHDVMTSVVEADKAVPAHLLRLMFHDCFIKGCDASVLLDDSKGNMSHGIERDAVPNQTLKGFGVIDKVKDALETKCPNVVSCADIIVLALQNAVVMIGGPFFPILTGRKDSLKSFKDEAEVEIPSPFGNISQTLKRFEKKGFSELETVSLLGAHSIGKISCQFILPRLSNFTNSGNPDPTVPAKFLIELNRTCSSNATSVPLGSEFGTQFFKHIQQGQGLLHSDQNMMLNAKTRSFVDLFSSEDASLFEWHFSNAMLKMSNLASPPGSQGEVRKNCSLPNSN